MIWRNSSLFEMLIIFQVLYRCTRNFGYSQKIFDFFKKCRGSVISWFVNSTSFQVLSDQSNAQFHIFSKTEAVASGFPGEAPASFILKRPKLELRSPQGKLLLPSSSKPEAGAYQYWQVNFR